MKNKICALFILIVFAKLNAQIEKYKDFITKSQDNDKTILNSNLYKNSIGKKIVFAGFVSDIYNDSIALDLMKAKLATCNKLQVFTFLSPEEIFYLNSKMNGINWIDSACDNYFNSSSVAYIKRIIPYAKQKNKTINFFTSDSVSDYSQNAFLWYKIFKNCTIPDKHKPRIESFFSYGAAKEYNGNSYFNYNNYRFSKMMKDWKNYFDSTKTDMQKILDSNFNRAIIIHSFLRNENEYRYYYGHDFSLDYNAYSSIKSQIGLFPHDTFFCLMSVKNIVLGTKNPYYDVAFFNSVVHLLSNAGLRNFASIAVIRKEDKYSLTEDNTNNPNANIWYKELQQFLSKKNPIGTSIIDCSAITEFSNKYHHYVIVPSYLREIEVKTINRNNYSNYRVAAGLAYSSTFMYSPNKQFNLQLKNLGLNTISSYFLHGIEAYYFNDYSEMHLHGFYRTTGNRGINIGKINNRNVVFNMQSAGLKFGGFLSTNNNLAVLVDLQFAYNTANFSSVDSVFGTQNFIVKSDYSKVLKNPGITTGFGFGLQYSNNSFMLFANALYNFDFSKKQWIGDYGLIANSSRFSHSSFLLNFGVGINISSEL